MFHCVSVFTYFLKFSYPFFMYSSLHPTHFPSPKITLVNEISLIIRSLSVVFLLVLTESCEQNLLEKDIDDQLCLRLWMPILCH